MIKVKSFITQRIWLNIKSFKASLVQCNWLWFYRGNHKNLSKESVPLEHMWICFSPERSIYSKFHLTLWNESKPQQLCMVFKFLRLGGSLLSETPSAHICLRTTPSGRYVKFTPQYIMGEGVKGGVRNS
jgi:hypothetical protein